VSSKNEARDRENPWEQIVTISVTFVASIVALVAGAPDKWLAVIFCTAVTFGGMISFFRKRWVSKKFWLIIASAFLVHLLLSWAVVGMVLRKREDIGLLPCLPVIFVESFLLYHIVRLLDKQIKASAPEARKRL
jgi:hypothetical protein